MRSRARNKQRVHGLLDTLGAVVEHLRAGASLRQAITATAGDPGSPLHPLATVLAAGAPLAAALRETALAARTRADGGDADLASACCVLAVHAEAGGDPLPAIRGLMDRIARRFAAREEAAALTTQSRLGARAILLLTPAFLLLVSLTDPRGMLASLAQPRTRLAVAIGLTFQVAGALWIRSIVDGATAQAGRTAAIPVLRAIRAVLAGRPRSRTDDDCAEAAEIIAFALEAGLSPTGAVRACAPFVPGAVGEALCAAAAMDDVPLRNALAETFAVLDGDAARRFLRSVVWSAELGVPLAPALRGLADDVRASTSIRLSEDVRRASIRVLVPLSVLVLPAFVLACLVPLFLGGLSGIAR